MKILHTSDWHLGKRLEGMQRLDEQSAFIAELNSFVEKEKVDIVIIAGDVFDTSVPTSEAERMFYDNIMKMGEICPVVALAGNHDDRDRLSAPAVMAYRCSIALVGDIINLPTGKFEGGKGYLRFVKGQERLNLGLLPYPSLSLIEPHVGVEGSYAEKVKRAIDLCCGCFNDGEINIFASHLFMSGAVSTDEKMLGGAFMLGSEVLPKADYIALGHIHKPQVVSHTKNAFYCGSPLSYHFGESGNKEFIIYDSTTKQVSHVPITSGKPLIRINVTNMAEAEERLSALENCHVELVYKSGVPLSPPETKRLRSFSCLRKITIESPEEQREIISRAYMTPAEMFIKFYERQRGCTPPSDLVDLFLSETESRDGGEE